MKNKGIVLALTTLALSASAQVPRELENLIPAGSTSIRMKGKTSDDKNCSVDFSMAMGGFSSTVYVYGDQGQLLSRRMGTFQIGLGHELQSVQENQGILTAVSSHEAEEAFASDSRATLKVQKTNDVISKVGILQEAKGFFGYKTESKETCQLN